MEEIVCAIREIIKGQSGAVIGVMGTLLGTILGWGLNALSSRGKLRLYVSKWKDLFEYIKDGVVTRSKTDGRVHGYTYTLLLDIFNSSATPKIMREIQVVFYNGKGKVWISHPDDESTRRRNGPLTFYSEVEPLNIPPRSVMQISLSDSTWENAEHELLVLNAKKVVLEYRDEKNKLRKMLVRSEDYSRRIKNQPEEATNSGQAQPDKVDGNP